MKFLLLSFILLFFSTIMIYPQWTNQNIVPEGNHLWSTFFIDHYTGWIAGSDGFLKKTTNAGLDWLNQNSGTSLTLRSVQFANQNIGWICGEEGLILNTVDGGQHWYEQTSGTTELLTSLNFCSEMIGYVVGYNETILKTTDGGLTWNIQNSGNVYDLFSVDFVDPLLGFAVGGRDSTIFLKTTDGGLSWFSKNSLINDAKIFNCIDFVDANVGYLGSGKGGGTTTSGCIGKTTDGGETWNYLNFSSPISKEDIIKHNLVDNPISDMQRGIRYIYFKDSQNGYAVGGTFDGWKRYILKTTDAGNTWQTKYYYKEQTGLLSVFVNSNGQGLAVGCFGVIYRTTDDGYSWTQILSGNEDVYTGDKIETIFMVNDSVGWAAGSRQGSQIYPMILKTTNGGKIWQTNFESTGSLFHNISDIFFLNENIGWAATGGIFNSGELYKTTDGGENWSSISTASNMIDKIFFITQNIGWGLKLSGTFSGIYKSVDGGNTWLLKNSTPASSLYFKDINHGWVVGLEGSILKSTDEGETWVSKTSGTSINLNSINFFDSNVGMCVGESGIILLSTDSGENWIVRSCGSTSELTSVKFTTSTNVWTTASDGKIYFSTDLGDTWTSYNAVTNNFLSTLFFTNEYTGWVGGHNSTLYKYNDYFLPVELVSFTATVRNGTVQLNWQTATELNNYGFQLERSIDSEVWTNVGFVEGQGNSTSTISYSFMDNNPIGGNKFQYRLKQIDIQGSAWYSSIVEVEIVPTDFLVYQNYPNPFNPTTKIRYQLPKESKVVLKIYGLLGDEVTTLINENKTPGLYEVELNAQNLASGTYIYRITAGEYVETKKMMLLK